MNNVGDIYISSHYIHIGAHIIHIRYIYLYIKDMLLRLIYILSEKFE